MDRNSFFIFVGLLLVAGAIFLHATNSRYTFAYSDQLTYAKLDTRTGEAWICGAQLDTCIPMTNKAAFLAYAEATRKPAECATAKNAEECADTLKKLGKNPFGAFGTIGKEPVYGGQK